MSGKNVVFELKAAMFSLLISVLWQKDGLKKQKGLGGRLATCWSQLNDIKLGVCETRQKQLPKLD